MFPVLLAPFLLGCAGAASQDLINALSGQESLTKFASLSNNYTSLVTAAQAGNLTGRSIIAFPRFMLTLNVPDPVLAPNDAAFDLFFSTSDVARNYNSTDSIEALLSYHFLKGVHSYNSFITGPQFIATLLANTSYTNVSGGQVVEVISNGTATWFNSTVNEVSHIVRPENDIVFNGGLIHVVDSVLVGASAVLVLAECGLVCVLRYHR